MKSSSTKSGWNNFFRDGYTPAEWFCIKLSLMLVVMPSLIYILFNRTGQPYPSGICHLVDCSLLARGYFRYLVSALLLLLAFLYLAEIRMRYVTFALFVSAMLIYSLDESWGIKARTGIYSLAFFTQFLAYRLSRDKNGPDLAKNRVQFTAQIIAAVYVLSAISKLSTSGMAWFSDSPNLALQIIKSYSYRYMDTGNEAYNIAGMDMALWVVNHPWLVKGLLAGALLLELFAFVLTGPKKRAFFYAMLLLAMHIGILLLMDVFFPTVMFPLLIFFINPLYILFLTGQSLYLSIIPKTTPENTDT